MSDDGNGRESSLSTTITKQLLLNDTDCEGLRQKVVACRQLALSYKHQGDLVAAKRALVESKQWKVQLDNALLALSEQQQQQQQQQQQIMTSPPPLGVDNANEQHAVLDEQGMDEAGLMDELGDDNNNHDNHDNHNNNETEADSATTFSLAEMMDLEMIQEFCLSGLPTPTLQDYTFKIQECKQLTLQKKQEGKTTEALSHLKCMKQLQAVHNVLEKLLLQQQQHQGGGTEDEEGDTPDDRALLRELMMDQGEGTNRNTSIHDHDDHNDGGNRTTILEMVDLMHMDLSEIQDAVEIGMHLPSLVNIQTQINHQKAQAVQLKNEGDLEGAKEALKTFKLWSQQYAHVEQVLLQQQQQRSLDTSGEAGHDEEHPMGIQEEDLEQLLENEDKPAPKTTLPAIVASPKIKSSDEWKQEAIRLRDEKKIEEATQALKQFKLALAREQEQKEQQERHECLLQIRAEIDTARIQYYRFILWERLVDAASGTQQHHAWWRYMDLCGKVMDVIETRGTTAISITRTTTKQDPVPPGSLRCLPDDLDGLVHRAMDPMEERLEIAIIDLMDLHKNKVFASLKPGSPTTNCKPCQWVRVDVHVSIQLPSSETETEKPIDNYFHSEPFELCTFLQEGETRQEKQRLPEDEWRKHGRVELTATTATAQHESSRYITLERGQSTFAKTLIRRMERRKITVSVLCHQVEDPNDPVLIKRKGWFGSNKKKPEEQSKEPLHLGKLVLETKTLLQDCPCIVKDSPLLGSGKREVGGRLRLCIRTGIPFGSKVGVNETRTSLASIPLYSDLSFSVNKESKEVVSGDKEIPANR